MFIVFEGLDGAGTTTQTELLSAWLRERGQRVETTREPSDGPIGTMIRQMLSKRIVGLDGGPIDRETLALLFAADRLDHVHNEIGPALQEGKYVVSDRYYHSSFAYQGDIDDEDHFDIEWVRSLNSRARTPDITFYLSVPVETCMTRLSDRGHRDIYETQGKLDRLAKRYDEIVAQLLDGGERIVVIDGSREIADVFSDVIAELQSSTPPVGQ